MRRRVLRMLLIGLLVGPVCFSLYLFVISRRVPDVSSLTSGFPERTSYMRLRASELGKAEDSFRVEPAEVLSTSPLLACAIVKSEDLWFFTHAGINWDQTMWSLTTQFTLSGASSITQQLARNVYLGPERTVHRKLLEMFTAHELERKLSKHRILELYLNVIEWGDGVWGAGPAARHYFNKSPAELDAFEASFLSALTAAPRHPLAGANLERAEGVQRRVLIQLYRAGLLDEKTWRDADTRSSAVFACLREKKPLATALTCTQAPPPTGEPTLFPFFVRKVAEPLQGNWLEQQCGQGREMDEMQHIHALRKAAREQGR
ncbi:MAG: transglycosylase domain-containing protein [Archangium sp.]